MARPGYDPPLRVIPLMKRCAKCLALKHHEHFQRKAAASDGLQVWCRDCFRNWRNSDAAIRQPYTESR